MFTLNQAILEQFTTDLVTAGFEPVPNTERRCWAGPISPSFAGLTGAKGMVLCLRDGWPFLHPHLMVPGLNVEHVSDQGVVCLWRDDDNSRTWLTLDGILRRIDEWCNRARQGFLPADRSLDAYMGFKTRVSTLATFDLCEVLPSESRKGDFGQLYGIHCHPTLIDLRPMALHSTRPAGSVRGHWFNTGGLDLPPRNMEEVCRCLTRPQRRTLEKSIARVISRGGVTIALIAGQRHTFHDVIVLRLLPDNSGDVRVESLEPAPRDRATLLFRSGPDAAQLSGKRVVCFGAGAIGSHTALALGESGVGHLHLVDGELLRPGNVVRHVAGHSSTGLLKVSALKDAIGEHAPFTRVEVTDKSLWAPSAIIDIIASADLVLDATGMAPMTEMLSRVAEQQQVPLISVALYRNGAIGRVRRQNIGSDTQIYLRGGDKRYPVIPSADSDEDDERLEMGCSSPVNNAPPSAVMAVSALAAQTSIDALTGRLQYPEEVIDIYKSLREPPFDQLGRIQHD